MAGPASIIGMGASLLGGLGQASGAAMSGSSQAGAYLYQASVARMNQQIAEQNSQYALAQGEAEALKYGISARQTMGGIKAEQSASGLDVNSGSNKQVQTSQQTVSQMDMDMIRTNAAKVAYNYQVEAANAGASANMATLAATNTRAAANTNVMTSLLGTASSVADKWLAGQDKGLWGAASAGLGA